MPEDWQPSPELRAKVTKDNELTDDEVARQTEAFRNYWLDRPEARAGWDGSYRNWMAKCGPEGEYRHKIVSARGAGARGQRTPTNGMHGRPWATTGGSFIGTAPKGTR